MQSSILAPVLVLLFATSAAMPAVPASHPATTRPTTLNDARRIVFLVDTRIGPALLFRAMQDELTLAIDHLHGDQFFTITVLRPQSPKVFMQNPVRADHATKQSAKEFVAAIDDERTINAVPGIAEAVELQPDVLCLIAGDNFPDTDAARRAFHPLHGTLNVFLFTAFVPHPNEFLRTLALEHGGRAIDQHGNELEPPKPPVVPETRQPESRPSLLER